MVVLYLVLVFTLHSCFSVSHQSNNSVDMCVHRLDKEEEKKVAQKVAMAKDSTMIDVDALWEEMTAGPVLARLQRLQAREPPPETPTTQTQSRQLHSQPPSDNDTVLVKTELHTHKQRVPPPTSQADASHTNTNDKTTTPARAPPRRAFRSAFEPKPTGTGTDGLATRRTDLDLSVRARSAAGAKAAKKRQLNTIEKSRLDWEGFVDQEGIRDELDRAGKSKEAYADREAFLARSDMKMAEEALRARKRRTGA